MPHGLSRTHAVGRAQLNLMALCDRMAVGRTDSWSAGGVRADVFYLVENGQRAKTNSWRRPGPSDMAWAVPRAKGPSCYWKIVGFRGLSGFRGC